MPQPSTTCRASSLALLGWLLLHSAVQPTRPDTRLRVPGDWTRPDPARGGRAFWTSPELRVPADWRDPPLKETGRRTGAQKSPSATEPRL